MIRLVLALILSLAALPAFAQLQTVQVTDRVFAFVGPYGQRSAGNLANNATFGAVLTDAGVVLIDPGGSHLGAQQIDRKLAEITDAPVVAVINTGGQDHRWLGNAYWADKGARVIASTAAVADQQARESLQMTVLTELLGPLLLAGTRPMVATETFDTSLMLDIGGVRFDLVHTDAAHTPGDSFVWLPGEGAVFSGDIVYVGRILGIFPFSSSKGWLASFEAMAALNPDHVIPGHGAPTDLFTAETDTHAYLADLRAAIRDHIDGGGDIIGSVEVDQSAYSHLVDFDLLARRNAQAVFEEMEWE
jgi:glyoxylase-like metal-dependent hydrolase (beta-lactamase superfamily II)